MAKPKVPSGMGPVFNSPPSGSIVVIVSGPSEVKSSDPKVKIVRGG